MDTSPFEPPEPPSPPTTIPRAFTPPQPAHTPTPAFRPLSPDERARQARRSTAMAHAARASIAERQARQLWPSRGPRADDDAPLPVRTPLAEPEPWPEPVDGAALLSGFAALIERHLYLPEHGATVLALWVLHAWSPAAGTMSPRLALASPEPQSGKTTALRLLAALTPRPLLAVHARAMPLIRTIDFLTPTLLFDDAERWLWHNRVLRSAVAAGHARDAKILRESKNPFELPALSCFAPCAFTVTGPVPADVARRAIALTLRPALGTEQRPPFNPESAEAKTLCAQAVRWSRDNADALTNAQADVAHLPRSQRELWRPLLAIAHTAGGEWAPRAEAASLAFAAQSDTRSLNVDLLEDVRIALDQAERMSTEDLITLLARDAEQPWRRMANGRTLNAHELAKRLSGFGVRPRTIRFADGTVRGYLTRDFADAFARYLGPRIYTAYEDM